MVITFTSVLYHRVTTWTSENDSGIPGVTPGRIAVSSFTPEATMKRLEGKEEGWMVQQMGGRLELLNSTC